VRRGGGTNAASFSSISRKGLHQTTAKSIPPSSKSISRYAPESLARPVPDSAYEPLSFPSYKRLRLGIYAVSEIGGGVEYSTGHIQFRGDVVIKGRAIARGMIWAGGNTQTPHWVHRTIPSCGWFWVLRPMTEAVTEAETMRTKLSQCEVL
jgi:hypothetical protein